MNSYVPYGTTVPVDPANSLGRKLEIVAVATETRWEETAFGIPELTLPVTSLLWLTQLGSITAFQNLR